MTFTQITNGGLKPGQMNVILRGTGGKSQFKDGFFPDCKDTTCRMCRRCYSEYVARKMAGELD